MSVVIIGGNERMVYKYEDICKNYGVDASGTIRKNLGTPDLLILFTNTASHKMVNTAVSEAKRNNIPVARVRSSSASALNDVLCEYCSQ